MGVDTAFVVDKGLVKRLVTVDPVADEVTQLGMVGVSAIELVGQGTEETVAVAESGGSVETEETELVVESAGAVNGVIKGEEL